ncbi:MAG: hypothetical protein IT256_03630 [Chitinophagaceae bacterium]|nr:hypothetical protein [Chitinophagaceae bacterium]
MKKSNESPKLENDFKEFVELCNKYEVRYLVIGGFAVSVHGYPRGTKDLDICIQSSEDNAKKMVDILKEFGFASLNLTKEDFLKKGLFTQLGYEPVRIDIMNDIDGIDYEVAWENKRTINYEGFLIHFIGYNELLRMKALAGRPQDIADIAKLKARNKGK